MYRRNDPRLRRTLNELSQTLEAANESAQASLFDLNSRYVAPCLAGVGECFMSCGEACFGSVEEQRRRQRRSTRGRAEANFDFYDDWDDDENVGNLGWGDTDELDRLLAGSGGVSPTEPRRRPGTMGYGAVSQGRAGAAARPADEASGHASLLGFVGSLPWGLGRRSVRYRPSAAGLQDHPGSHHDSEGEEGEPLIGGEEGGPRPGWRGKGRHKRERSYTNASSKTAESLSSRGDIYPSGDELDDAQPLDDEFALVLERRAASLGSDEAAGDLSRGRRRSDGSGASVSATSAVALHEAAQGYTPQAVTPHEGTGTVGSGSRVRRVGEPVEQDEGVIRGAAGVADRAHTPKELRDPPEAQTVSGQGFGTGCLPSLDTSMWPPAQVASRDAGSPESRQQEMELKPDFVGAALPRFGEG